LIRHADERFIPEAKKVFANSQTVAERLMRYNRIESEPLYHPPPRAEHLRAGELGDYVFYPSRLEPQKRQELLIEALRYTRTPVRAIFAGGHTRERAHYESLIKQHGVEDRVHLRGFVEESEMIDLYANALAVCYLPFDEDYGYVTLEGMLSSRPVVVAKDGGGATEFIEHEREGFLVESDPRHIAECLDTLYTDRTRARQMGTRGHEKVQSMNLSWKHVVEKIITATQK